MKYHSKKTVIDGIRFDSMAEADRYRELKLLERAGKIRALTLQPKFTLIPSFKKGGKTYRKVVYIADFQYYDIPADKIVIEDVKGFKTPVYRLKKTLFEFTYPQYEITEVYR